MSVFRSCLLLGGVSPPWVVKVKKCGGTPQDKKHERNTLAFAGENRLLEEANKCFELVWSCFDAANKLLEEANNYFELVWSCFDAENKLFEAVKSNFEFLWSCFEAANKLLEAEKKEFDLPHRPKR